ncbi:MAG: ABC transporter permease [Longimicrobiales bacterium]
METLIHDLRFALKLLRKERALTSTVLLTLAVCIGANATIFSVINTILLKPLPYPEPDQVVTVFNSYPGAGAERASSSGPEFFLRRGEIDAFQEVASFQGWSHTVGEAGSTERARSMRVTSTFFPLLRVSPALGRNFTWEEMEPGNHQKVILSHHFWQDRYAGDPGVLGRDLRVDGEPFSIIGVLPEGFRVAGENQLRDLWVPIPFSPEERSLESWHNNSFTQLARLAPGAGIEQAQAQIDAQNERLLDQWPVPNARQILEDTGFHTIVRSAKDDMLREIRPSLLMLWAGVAFVLLIGCVNIANLMLARSNVRMRELATRLALGADRTRLGRQLLTEAVLLGALGGILGLLLGYAGLQLLTTLGVDELPRGAEISLDGAVAVFTLGLGLLTGLIFGAIPLVNVIRSDLNVIFRSENRSGTASRGMVWMRNGLVVGQVAIAFVLLIGAGLMLRSFREVLDLDPGFETEGVVTGLVPLSDARYPDGRSRAQFADRLLQEVRAIPGIQAASLASQLPFGGDFSSSVILPEGYIPEPGESMLSPFQTRVGTEYFEAMGIPLVRGRTFEAEDTEESRQVVVLDEWLADRYFPGEDPIGKRMLYGTVPGMEEDQEPYLYTIVGVVASHRQNSLVESAFVGAYYFPYAQRPSATPYLVLKAARDPMDVVEPARGVIARLDPEIPFYGVRTQQERVDASLLERRSPMLLLMIFAGVALFLAGVGIYGTLAYSVTQRTREMGLRMAIGSSSAGVFKLVVGQGLRVLGAGLILGGLGSLILTRLIRSLLYGVQPSDPGVMATVALVLAITGVLACVLPASRATRIDPVVALTTE